MTEPTSGHVEIDGKKIIFEREELLEVRQKVGIVFQDPNDQLFAPTVKEDVAFGPMNLGLEYDEVKKRIEEALEMVGMSGFEDKTPHHLSGGQQKRVAIAGIVAMRPDIMILDEPTAGLDPEGDKELLKKAHLKAPVTTEILYKLKENGLNVDTEKLSIEETVKEILKAKNI